MPEAGPAHRASEEGSRAPRWTRIALVALIVLVPTCLVAYVVFGAGRGTGSGPAGPATAAPVVAGGRSATNELLGALDPSLDCTAADQVTVARVDELFAAGRLGTGSIPAPAGAVTCDGGGIVRDYVVFSRADDARSLFETAAAATGAETGTGPGSDCRHIVRADFVVLTCAGRPDVVWSARASGLTGAAVLERLGR